MSSTPHHARSPAPRRRPAATLMLALLAGALLGGCGDSPDKLLDSARGYLAKQDLQAASIQLKNALQKDGSLAEARFLLGQVNLELGDVPGAVKELQRAEELGVPAERVAPLLASALVRTAEFDQVIARYGKTRLTDEAAQARLSAALGTAYLAKAQVEQARVAYAAATAAAPDDAGARLGLARAMLFADDIEGAQRELAGLLQQHPEHAEAHALQAQIMMALNRPDAAVDALSAAVRSRADTLAYRYELVTLLLRLGRVDEARAQLETMRQASPDNPGTRYLQALMAYREGRDAEAREQVQLALRSAPDFLPGHLLAGSVLFRSGEQLQAQAHLGRVLDLVPGQSVARQLMALSLVATSQPARALETIGPLIDAAPTDIRSLTVIGQVLLANGEFERAAEYFARASAIQPDSPGARMRLGVARLGTGESVQALADLEAAAAMDAPGFQADAALILAHLRAGNTARALEAADALIAKQPDNAEAYNLKGGVLMSRRDAAGARAAFEKALQVNPELLAAVINLARIDLSEGAAPAAAGRFEAYLKAYPSNPEAYVAYADLKTVSAAPAGEVQAILERAAAAVPGAVQPRLAMVRHHLRQGDNRRALAVAQELAAANPNLPAAVEALARAQTAAGEHQQAISAYGRLANLLPQSPAPLVEMAGVQQAAKDLNGAEQTLRRAIAMQPEQVEARRRLVLLLMEQQRFDDALVQAREMQARPALAAMGQEAEGDVHVRRSNWEQAVAAFRKAANGPRAGEVTVKQHAALLRLGRDAEAGRLAAEYLRTQRNDTVMRSYLAERAISQNKLVEAKALYEELLRVVPDNALVYNNLAWVAGQLKDPAAVAHAERALALAPDNPAILDTLGMLLIERGDSEKGLASLTRAVSLAPQLPPLRMNLAKAYLKLDRKADAREQLDTLLGQVPADTPLHREAADLRAGL